MEVLSSCLTNCVLQSSMDEMIKIPIAFKAPALSHTGIVTYIITYLTKYKYHYDQYCIFNLGDDTRAFSACLRIELDTPGPSPVLGKVSLRAIVGIVRLYTRPEDETISLKYPSLATKTFPLKNAGAVSVNVAITPEDSQRLTVVPKNIVLMPGEQMPVQVTFHPPDIHSTLQR